MTDAGQAVRPAKQERSRVAWDRALEVGCALLEQGGADAVTIASVCQQGRISPPSLYARVDGRAGLLAAIYEHGMLRVRALEDRALTPLADPDASVEARIRHVAEAVHSVFRAEQRLLRAVIGSSVQDERIHRSGVEESRRVQATMIRLLELPADVGRDIAAMIFAEMIVHTVYGGEFTADDAEGDDAYLDRLVRMGVARTAA